MDIVDSVTLPATMQGYMLAAIGVSHGGKTTKIHAVVDALGNPAHFLLTGRNIFDASVAVVYDPTQK